MRPEHIVQDPDLDNLRDDARFEGFLEKVKNAYARKKGKKSKKGGKKHDASSKKEKWNG